MSRKYKQHHFRLKSSSFTKEGKREYMKKYMKLYRDQKRKHKYKPRKKRHST